MASIGVVITACQGREDNLRRVLSCLARQTVQPSETVVVLDGCDVHRDGGDRVKYESIPKHTPGQEQPRNVGVRALGSETTHVWFLDSDLVFFEDLLETYLSVLSVDPDRVLIGPYDWMPPGQIAPVPGLRNDPRWASFSSSGPDDVRIGDLGHALACFGGNLVWPVGRFKDVGGFHPALWHGRCEDGELGLRAASRRVPMSMVSAARAWHVDHPRDVHAIHEKNRRDVPLLNSMHPWVESRGLVVTHEDGARFDFVCPRCGDRVNSLEYWEHMSGHG